MLRYAKLLAVQLRASALVEGIGISFDPAFNGVRVARPIVKRMVAGQIREFERGPIDWITDRVRQALALWDDFTRLVYRAERDQWYVHIHPADMSQIERYFRVLIWRLLLGLSALGLGLFGGAFYLRTGNVLWIVATGIPAVAAFVAGFVLPMRKRGMLRDDSRS